MESDPRELTTLLIDWRQGDQHAGEKLMAISYDQLRHLAAHYFRQEPRGHTLQATALYIRA